MKNIKVKNTMKALLVFLGLFLIQAVMSFVVGIVYGIVIGVQQIPPEEQKKLIQDSQMVITIYASLASALLSLLWCFILYIRSDQRNKNNYSDVFSKSNILGMVSCGIAGSAFVSMLLTAVSNLIPGSMAGYIEHMEPLSAGNSWISLLYVVFVGPVAEELIFRGAIFDRFNRAFSFWVANILQALFFGIYHFNLVQGIYAFLLGIVLGMVIHAAGSILASISVHILFNAASYILQVAFSSIDELNPAAVIVLMVVCGAVCVSGIYYFARKCRMHKEVVQEDIGIA